MNTSGRNTAASRCASYEPGQIPAAQPVHYH